MKVILVKTNNTYVVEDVKDATTLIEGYTEMVTPVKAYDRGLLLKDNAFICDEEGLIKGLSKNHFASILYDHPSSYIAGDVVIVGLYFDLISLGLDYRGLTVGEIEYYERILEQYGLTKVGE